LVSVPLTIPASCRAQGARVYDKCTDQQALFETARRLAQEQNKTVLVSYGADWCIWCHVLDKYLAGYSGAFDYEYGTPDSDETYQSTLKEKAADQALAAQQARALAEYAAKTFVLFHLESDVAPGSYEVLESTEADAHYAYELPFVFTVTSDGRFASALGDDASIRRDGTLDWYRGYDREKLLSALKVMKAAADEKSAG
jgi:hypothetical protein